MVDIETIKAVAKTFGGVEHRAEFVREYNGVKYYNDSIASSPTRTALGTLSLYDEKSSSLQAVTTSIFLMSRSAL